MGLLLLGIALAGPAAASSPPTWPTFLPSREAFAPDTAATIDRVWTDHTLSRTVRGRPARAPFDLYVALVDLPEVTAAAARHLKLARYEVEPLGDDWYRATDGAGARGLYRVLVREPSRRVVLSWGEHAGRFLGTITGSALTLMEFTAGDDRVEPALTAWVRIDNPVAAAFARVLVPLFGHLADRKLAEGFTVAAGVSEWAVERPQEFCEWLASESLAPERTQRLRALLGTCS